ncbi:MAG: GHKL domain-containing protein [Chromatiales bacterium]|nr:GHKL domain-containing protein [Chromatiales bacterium]
MMALRTRLAIAAGAVLVVFLGLTVVALVEAFKDARETALRDTLQAHVYTLLATTDLDAQGLPLVEEPAPVPDLETTGSGLIARILDPAGAVLWQSPSAVGEGLAIVPVEEPGTMLVNSLDDARGRSWLIVRFGVIWETEAGAERPMTIALARDRVGVQAQVARFAQGLWLWLGALAAVLLAALLVVLHWGLRPLAQVAGDLRHISAGEANAIDRAVPRELAPLTGAVNSLLESGRARQMRYANALDELAHSLKTPLAVLHGAVQGESDANLRASVREQAQRMHDIVRYQLGRAAAGGTRALLASIALRPVLEEIRGALAKVYRDKSLSIDLAVDKELRAAIERGDLMEIFGNLLDNACKWARREIRVAATVRSDMIVVTVADDGPGIAEPAREAVLERGVRADERVDGQGIGLAVVRELVAAYGGALKVGADPDLRGALVTIEFPRR